MNAEDMIRSHVRGAFLKSGYSEREANEVAENAIRKYRRNTPHKKAMQEALADGKRLYKKAKKNDR